MKAGWKTVKLGEACKIVNGATPSTSVEANWGGPHCWITPAEMGGLSDPYVGETRRTLTDVGLADCSTSLLPKGSVILSSRAPIGHVIINTVPMATNQGCKSMIPRSDLDAKFLFYFIKANVPLLESLGTGATFKELSGGKLASVEIPLPPLAEQKRIVALLDEAFAGIDEAKAKTEANLEKATAVFESHLQSLFAIDNPDWARAKLSSLTTKIGSGATPRGGEESYKDEGVSLIRSLNVHDYGFKYAKLAFLDAVQAEELSGVTVQENDVLLNITGASVARCTIVPRGVLPARVNQHVAIIRPMPEKVSSAFLHYLLISQPYKSRLLETGEEGGSTRQAITKAQLLEFTISHPVSVETQQATAKHLDEVREQTQRLSQLHKQRLDALSALKQSILSQAFAGELTA